MARFGAVEWWRALAPFGALWPALARFGALAQWNGGAEEPWSGGA